MKYVFDIETYPNFFLVVFYSLSEDKHYLFEISQRKDDTISLATFLKKNKGCSFIGFNCINYDYPMIHFFILQLSRLKEGMTTYQLVKSLANHSKKLISNLKRGYGKKIKNPLFNIIDLFLINHFNNGSKMTSLKEIEFNLRLQNIQELPFDPEKDVTFEEMDQLIIYCRDDDVNATRLFYLECVDAIAFRVRMSTKYGINLTNANDVKIGEEILIDALHSQLGWEKEDIRKMRTYRNEMSIDEITLPYISFRSVEFQEFLKWWKTKVITETKGQFSKVDIDYVAEILPHMERVFISRNTKVEKLNIVYKNFKFDFGTGGIHGTLRPGVWKASEKKKVKLVDVSSFYPNTASKNGFHPEHFPQDVFVNVIDILYQQRMAGRDIGDNEVVKAIKLALNGALYGKSNDKYSCMYDPQMMMTICVNCQLLMVMLAEKILDENIEIIQINTDGIFVYVDVSQEDTLDRLCKEWMELTNLKLDYDHFDLMVQKDCNNYLARFTDGKIKYKGAAFGYKNLDWHKDHSALIVQRAVEAYFIHGLFPEHFIPTFAELENKNLYDFFLRAKLVRKEYSLFGVLGDKRHQLQRITRYFVANEGMYLEKEMPPLKGKVDIRISAIEKGFQVIPCNDLGNFVPSEIRNNLNYDYYIEKTYNTINAVLGTELTHIKEEKDV